MNCYILLDLSNYHVWIGDKEIQALKNICLENEGRFDPFMLFGNIFTNDQYDQWQIIMNHAFDNWLQEMSRKQFNEMYRKTKRKFNYNQLRRGP